MHLLLSRALYATPLIVFYTNAMQGREPHLGSQSRQQVAQVPRAWCPCTRPRLGDQARHRLRTRLWQARVLYAEFPLVAFSADMQSVPVLII